MIELRVLGPLSLTRDGHEVASLLGQPKRLALLCHLALAPRTGYQRRDTLLALFWPELSEARARAALRQSIHVIRRAIGDEAVVSRGTEEIGVDRRLLWCDAVAFEEHSGAGRYDAALAIYAGPLLDGFFLGGARQFEEWLDDRRAALCARAVRDARLLAAAAELEGDLPSAVIWARRVCRLAPDDEHALAALLSLLLRSGDRCGAVRDYERFARRLRREFGMEPAGETQSLIRRMREPALAEAANAVPALR